MGKSRKVKKKLRKNRGNIVKQIKLVKHNQELLKEITEKCS